MGAFWWRRRRLPAPSGAEAGHFAAASIALAFRLRPLFFLAPQLLPHHPELGAGTLTRRLLLPDAGEGGILL